jgi:hypothetical protein
MANDKTTNTDDPRLAEFRRAHPEFANLSTEDLSAVARAITAAGKPHDEPPSDNEGPARVPTEAATTALVGIAALRTGLANVAASRSSHGGMPLLKMVKGVGNWVVGKNETSAEPGAQWAANPFSAAHGYISWAQEGPAKKLGEQMVPVTVAKPAALPTTGTPWDDQMAINLKCLNGRDRGLEVTFKSSAKGGIDAVVDLLEAVGRRIDIGARDFVPIVTLEHETYPHQQFGKIFKPVFAVVGWADMQGGTEAPQASPSPAAAAPAPPSVGQPIRRRQASA